MEADPAEGFDVGAILSIARRYIIDTKHNVLYANYAAFELVKLTLLRWSFFHLNGLIGLGAQSRCPFESYSFFL